MSPDAFERLVDESIQAMVEHGFHLIKGDYGYGMCGCALTALYQRKEGINQYLDLDEADLTDWLHQNYRISYDDMCSFLVGYDDLYVGGKSPDFGQAGVRIRLKWQDHIEAGAD